jgi:hypothetical protein
MTFAIDSQQTSWSEVHAFVRPMRQAISVRARSQNECGAKRFGLATERLSQHGSCVAFRGRPAGTHRQVAVQ